MVEKIRTAVNPDGGVTRKRKKGPRKKGGLKRPVMASLFSHTLTNTMAL
jgi:hypothetical protein